MAGSITIFEPQEIGKLNVVRERRATGLQAPKLWKGRSGYTFNCTWYDRKRGFLSFFLARIFLSRYKGLLIAFRSLDQKRKEERDIFVSVTDTRLIFEDWYTYD